MLLTRASWVQIAGGQLAKAATIAVRYSAVRKQGFVASGDERQLLDYTVQRRRLLTQARANSETHSFLMIALTGSYGVCGQILCEETTGTSFSFGGTNNHHREQNRSNACPGSCVFSAESHMHACCC